MMDNDDGVIRRGLMFLEKDFQHQITRKSCFCINTTQMSDDLLSPVYGFISGRMSDAKRWRGYQIQHAHKKEEETTSKEIHADTCVSFLTPGHVTTPFYPAGITDPLQGMLLTHTQQLFSYSNSAHRLECITFPLKRDRE